jgi:hypothetical protein
VSSDTTPTVLDADRVPDEEIAHVVCALADITHPDEPPVGLCGAPIKYGLDAPPSVPRCDTCRELWVPHVLLCRAEWGHR